VESGDVPTGVGRDLRRQRDIKTAAKRCGKQRSQQLANAAAKRTLNIMIATYNYYKKRGLNIYFSIYLASYIYFLYFLLNNLKVYLKLNYMLLNILKKLFYNLLYYILFYLIILAIVNLASFIIFIK